MAEEPKIPIRDKMPYQTPSLGIYGGIEVVTQTFNMATGNSDGQGSHKTI